MQPSLQLSLQLSFGSAIELRSRPVTELWIWCQHNLFRDHMGHPVSVNGRFYHSDQSPCSKLWQSENIFVCESQNLRSRTPLSSGQFPSSSVASSKLSRIVRFTSEPIGMLSNGSVSTLNRNYEYLDSTNFLEYLEVMKNGDAGQNQYLLQK